MNLPAATPTGEPLVTMQGVRLDSARQPGRVLMEGVDWQVHAGDFWVLAGLQGTGKTAFLTLTAGLMPPAAGQVRLFDTPLTGVSELPLSDRLRAGVLFEHAQLQATLTIAENIALPHCYHAGCRMEDCADWVQALLEFTGTVPVAGQFPPALSRDWRLRAGLARALVMKPELLLLDNPVAGLDPRQSDWWQTRLQQLAAGHAVLGGRPLTLVLTVSDLRPWRATARQFAILKQRRLVQADGARGADAAVDQLQAQLLELEMEPS